MGLELVLTAEFLVTARPTQAKIDLLVKQMKLAPEQVEMCIEADPSPNQTDYVTWLARWLKKGRVRLPEDSPRLKEMLSTFTVQKRQPTFQGNRDINAYDPAQLSEVLEQNAMTVVRGGDLDKLRAMAGVELVGQKGYLTVFKTTDPKALSKLSDSTSWCTRHESTASHYLKSGPSYVAFWRGQPYAQLHSSSNQFMDKHDRPLYEEFRQKGGRGWGRASYRVLGRGIWDQVAIDMLGLIGGKDPQVEKWKSTHASMLNTPEEVERLRRNVGAGWWISPENEAKLALVTNTPAAEDTENSRLWEVEPRLLRRYKDKFHPQGRWRPMEESVLHSKYGISEGIDYAKEVVGGRWPELEKKILRRALLSEYGAEQAVQYAEEVVRGRWPELERKLGTGKGSAAGHAAYNYSIAVLKAPWSSVEGVARDNWANMPAPEWNLCGYDPEHAIDYAEKWGWKEWSVLRDRLVAQGKTRWYIHYLGKVEKRRDPALEARLLSPDEVSQNRSAGTDKQVLAATYATEVIHGRWPELEARLLAEAGEEETPLLSSMDYRSGRRQERPQFLFPDRYYYTRLRDGAKHYITRAIKDRWPELEAVILRRYNAFPLQWEENQELLFAYLRVLGDISRISMANNEEEEPAAKVSWPEGERRLGERSPTWEGYLNQHGREITLDASREQMYNPWERVYSFEEKIHDYISFIRSHGGDWREGVKLLNWMEDKRRGEPFGDGLGFRMEERKAALLRRRRLLPLREGK